MRYFFKPKGTCSTNISFELIGDLVKNVEFTDGCNGNLKAISILVDGMPAEKLIKTLKGNTCGRNPTSCADQLAKAVESAYLGEE